MSKKTLTFEAHRAGISNKQTIHLNTDPILSPTTGSEETGIMISIIDPDPQDTARPIETNIHVHGLEDVNELADFLIHLGHQIGHDLGATCHLAQAVKEKINAVEVDPTTIPGLSEAINDIMTALANKADEKETGE